MNQRTLDALGIPATKHGHWYIEYAVEISTADRSLLLSITKRLYPEIAAHFHMSSQSVEQCIRYSIRQGWETGNRQLFYDIAGYQLKSCPYASEFIAMLVDYEGQMHS